MSWRCFMLIKLEWLGYRMVKNYDDMLSRFHLIPEHYGRTDRQTDIIAISISRVTVLTRDKNQHWVYQIYVQQLLLTYTDAFYPGKRTWNKQLWGQEVKGQGHMRSKIDLEAWWHSKVTRLGVGQSRDLVKVNSAFFSIFKLYNVQEASLHKNLAELTPAAALATEFLYDALEWQRQTECQIWTSYFNSFRR